MSYKVNDKEYDYNSNKNQTIKGEFVRREIYCSVYNMVDYILNKSWEDSEVPFSYEDIENYYIDNSEDIEKKESRIEEIEGKLVDLDEDIDNLDENSNDVLIDINNEIKALEDEKDNLTDEIEELKRDQEKPQEIFEWWKVSSFLANKLKEYGEPIILGDDLWGRCTFGQAIFLDQVISDICYDMKILEGQKNSWENK